MRLIRQLQRLEASHALAETAGPAIGLAWSERDERVDVAQLEPGEYIAVDVHVLGEACPEVDRWLVRERITRDSRDLGWVLDAAGEVVGRVAEISGSLLTLRYEAVPGAAASWPACGPSSARRVAEP